MISLARSSFMNAGKFAQGRAMMENWALADRVGFEPTVGLHPRRFSRPLP
jgi:hypothetical protein